MNERACDSVGIDLGTTYSAVAYVDTQLSPKIVINESGQSIVPSVVFFDEDDIIVGDMALNSSKSCAENVVQFIKIHMGEKWRRTFHGHEYTPESISAIILRHLVLMAEAQLGSIGSAVITVPAFFNEKRRRATQQAGEIAGLKVIGTLNEPMAATLAYGLHHRETEETVLVYDLGGGTFDVTAVRITPTEIRELATDGNRELGGKDWDQALIDLVAEDFIARHGVDPRHDRQGAQDLQLACEFAKRTLSKKTKALVRINAAGHDHVAELTRELFEERTQSLLQSTKLTAELVLSQAGLGWGDISRVVPVGGSTLMPAVRKMLTDAKGTAPDFSVNPVMAVALGAGIYAHMLETGKALKTVTLQPEPAEHAAPPNDSPVIGPADGGKVVVPESRPREVKFVTAHGLGIRVMDETGSRWMNAVLIKKNTPVPAKSTIRRFQLDVASQPGSFVKVEITQGDTDDIAAAEVLGEALIQGFPPRSTRSSVPRDPKSPPFVTEFVDVSLEFDEQGRLQMSAEYRDTATNTRQQVCMTLDVVGGLQPEEVEEQRRHMQDVAFLKLFKPET